MSTRTYRRTPSDEERNRLFAIYVEPHIGFVRNLVRCKTLPAENLDDNCQDVLLHLLLNIHFFRPECGTFYQWARTVVANKMLMIHRRTEYRHRKRYGPLRGRPYTPLHGPLQRTLYTSLRQDDSPEDYDAEVYDSQIIDVAPTRKDAEFFLASDCPFGGASGLPFDDLSSCSSGLPFDDVAASDPPPFAAEALGEETSAAKAFAEEGLTEDVVFAEEAFGAPAINAELAALVPALRGGDINAPLFVEPDDYPRTYSALMALTAGQRRALLLTAEGWSPADIARDFNLTVSAVYSLLLRARNNMKLGLGG